jgi:hypothetical protein
MKAGATELEAIRMVADHYSAEWDGVTGDSGPRLQIGGKSVALAVLAMTVRSTGRGGPVEPRLRFDRGVLRLSSGLRDALAQAVPASTAVIVTVTAPIRLRARTQAVLIEKIRAVLTKRPVPARLAATVHGNRVQVRTMKGGRRSTCPIVTFVHNPKPAPAPLFDAARALLTCLGSTELAVRGSQRERWLVIANPHGTAPIRTIRHVAECLCAPGTFSRMLAVGARGRVEELER